MSKYTDVVEALLKEKHIQYKKECTFEGLRGNKFPLRFDYVIYKDNKIFCFLEVNGEQHYTEVQSWGGKSGLKKRQEYDRKKMRYALANNIPLYCIPYWQITKDFSYENIFQPKNLVKSIWHNDLIKKG